MQLRALQLSDRWAPAVQRTTRPLAKPVQIAAGVYAAKSTRTTPVTGNQGARDRVADARATGGKSRNGSDEDWRRNAGFCNEVRVLEPHPVGVDITRF
jgi:hypothetical protein